ncbi:hypothetical protein CC85DRAFT_299915 [Cutaneotrichosporon oleaginosum]|uniref:Uncharacterized protein n=1 Tax=Cutaneotrichosporon oleaginosum TaxID=879819 RepID=A0A0J0XVE8_9TREE|nr:uncharacterized protein CC85DRAFT_299915 [Cutaneotrichosporon oleaginosum]KLT45045.1 hypothetical protein CC85DRAFT_299915 [Cutaneotrichosporon oleaginosum]
MKFNIIVLALTTAVLANPIPAPDAGPAAAPEPNADPVPAPEPARPRLNTYFTA